MDKEPDYGVLCTSLRLFPCAKPSVTSGLDTVQTPSSVRLVYPLNLQLLCFFPISSDFQLIFETFHDNQFGRGKADSVSQTQGLVQVLQYREMGKCLPQRRL